MKKYIFGITVIAIQTLVFAQIPTNSLVAHWNFSGNANDITGNGNHGTVYNATLTCDRCGNPNSAYGFNGTNAKIVVPHSSWIDMNNSNDFSLCMWVKTYQNPNIDAVLLSKNLHGNWSSYMVFANSTNGGYCNTYGHLSFYTASGAFQDACSNDSICTGNLPPGQLEDFCNNNWYFITGVYEAATSTSSLFINGILQADIGGISGSLSNACNLILGAHMNGSIDMHFFKGALDDIRIYKKKLIQSEIMALYDENCNTSPTDLKVPGLNNSITVFPNPTNSALYVNSTETIVSITIADIAGKQIKNLLNIQKREVETDLQTFEPGIYLLKIQTSSGVKVIKVMKD